MRVTRTDARTGARACRHCGVALALCVARTASARATPHVLPPHHTTDRGGHQTWGALFDRFYKAEPGTHHHHHHLPAWRAGCGTTSRAWASLGGGGGRRRCCCCCCCCCSACLCCGPRGLSWWSVLLDSSSTFAVACAVLRMLCGAVCLSPLPSHSPAHAQRACATRVAARALLLLPAPSRESLVSGGIQARQDRGERLFHVARASAGQEEEEEEKEAEEEADGWLASSPSPFPGLPCSEGGSYQGCQRRNAASSEPSAGTRCRGQQHDQQHAAWWSSVWVDRAGWAGSKGAWGCVQ